MEAGQIIRLHEGTRERCFAPIRNGQILRHDGILSRYQVALRREGGPRSAAKWRPRHALCVFSRSASRAGVFVPRTGARRSSPGSLHRGRWPGCSPFGGLGRCGLLFSAPPMCRAGWSRSPGVWCRRWLLSGGDLNPPGPVGPPPASGGLAPPMRRRRCRGGGAHTAKSNRLGRLPTLREWLRHAVATARPLRIARDYGGFTPSPRPSPSGEGGEGSRPLRRGTGRRGRRPGHPSEARPRPKEPPSTQGEHPARRLREIHLDKLSAVVVQLYTRGRIGSGITRCPPVSTRESRSGKSPEGSPAFRAFILHLTAHQRDHRRIQCA